MTFRFRPRRSAGSRHVYVLSSTDGVQFHQNGILVFDETEWKEFRTFLQKVGGEVQNNEEIDSVDVRMEGS